MIVNDDGNVMLLAEELFKTFTSTHIDSVTHTQAIIALSSDRKDQVNDIVNRALAAGGQRANMPTDEGFTYGWSFQDLDPRLREVIYMDPKAFAQ